MTDDFDFDFDVDRGRSGSRTQDRETETPPETGNGRESSDPESGNGHGSKGNGGGLAAGAKKLLNRRPELVYTDEENGTERKPRQSPPVDQGDADWGLSLDDGGLAPPRQDDTPAGTPGEARRFAKEARRRASRRPSPILHMNEERERLEQRDAGEEDDVDFESMLSQQPQKSGAARRGSALRSAFRGSVENLRRVGGERIADSRDRMQALKERVPSQMPQPRPASGGGDGKPPPPPPRLPRRIASRRPRKPKPGRIKWFRIAIIVCGLGLLAIVSTFFGMMMAISRDLPQLENRKEFTAAQNSEVFDDQGNKIGTLLNNNHRVLLDSQDISPYMKNAVVAIEDERFYEHRGVDLKGMFRAGLADVLPGGSTQGASTITQQFVKNAVEAQGNRTVFQKFREAALAYHLERQWDKDKILTEYLNTIYFGEGAYGIEAAASTYFAWNHPGCGEAGKDPCAKVLYPYEAAMLAGIITSPSAYSPRVNPQAAMDRRNLVLSKMKDQGYIGEDEYQDGIGRALPAPSDVEHPQGDSVSPYFSDWLRQQVVDLYGPGRAFSGGLDIHTTLDLEMQQKAEEIAGGMLSGIAPTASLVVLDNKTAAIKAMVGGYDFEKYPFNLATSGHRQPGSAFKPFTLATALAHGHSPSECYASQPKEFRIPGVSPRKEVFPVHNYEDRYLGGCVDLATATKYSDNSVFAELGMNIVHSPQRSLNLITQTARDMGIETDINDGQRANPALILGGLRQGVTPLEMTHAYSTIANDGARVSGNLDTEPGSDKTRPNELGPVAISEIDDPDGKAVAKNKTIREQVLSPSVGSTLKSLLGGPVSSGGTGATATLADFGKTGTTENYGDAWFCGGNDDFTACVWVGHRDTNTPMETEYNGGPVAGGTWPASIWNSVIAALEDIKAQHEADDGHNSSDSSDSSDSSSSSSSYYGGSSGSSSSSSGTSSGSSGGGGGGGHAPAAPAPAPSGGGGTGGTGL